jgi:predicted ATP-grasp superfamily ATP-dependent carboligase
LTYPATLDIRAGLYETGSCGGLSCMRFPTWIRLERMTKQRSNTHAKMILVGIDTPIGLSIVRELGSRGVEIYGLARGPEAVGLYSKYLHRGYMRRTPGPALIEQILQIAREAQPCYVMAVSESDIQLLNQHRPALSEMKLLIPEQSKMSVVVDKHQTNRLARKVGIRVPNTFEILDMGDLEGIRPSLRFPIILKWRNPAAVAPILKQAGLPLEKARYCYSDAELTNCLSAYQPVQTYPLIQEYCRGYGLGQFLFMHQGHALLRFQHRRLNEWPPEGGFASMCEAIPLAQHRELMDKSIALLRRIGWEGAAMVEYRFDPAAGEAYLMEVNGRFWGSLPLAYHSRAPFAWLTYCVLGNGQLVEVAEPAEGLRCRFMIPEIKRLGRILFQSRAIQDKALRFNKAAEILSFALDFLSPRTRYYVFSLHDPKPFLADLFFSLKGLLKTVLISTRSTRSAQR